MRRRFFLIITFDWKQENVRAWSKLTFHWYIEWISKWHLFLKLRRSATSICLKTMIHRLDRRLRWRSNSSTGCIYDFKGRNGLYICKEWRRHELISLSFLFFVLYKLVNLCWLGTHFIHFEIRFDHVSLEVRRKFFLLCRIFFS